MSDSLFKDPGTQSRRCLGGDGGRMVAVVVVVVRVGLAGGSCFSFYKICRQIHKTRYF